MRVTTGLYVAEKLDNEKELLIDGYDWIGKDHAIKLIRHLETVFDLQESYAPHNINSTTDS